MLKVSVATLKAELSKYLDLVLHGEAVIVTSHGEEIAKIGPAQAVTSPPVNWKKFFAENLPIKAKQKGVPASQIIRQIRDEE